ncbi:MAG: AAA family ATPase [Myxococcales bacterium]|nr:AAA family ATPase [Myxococcales bacterium]
MIIGLTGRNGAGKGTVAEWFTARGYHFTSLSDAIRRDLRARGLEVTRDNLIAGGRRLRTEGGAAVLGAKSLAHIRSQAPGDWVVDSVRNPAEVTALRESADFVLLDVTAAPQTRYDRVVLRNRGGDATSFAEFLRQEEAELNSTDEVAQRLVATAKLADFRVSNDGDVQALHHALESLFPEV